LLLLEGIIGIEIEQIPTKQASVGGVIPADKSNTQNAHRTHVAHKRQFAAAVNEQQLVVSVSLHDLIYSILFSA
jgi:hypothetical protein